MYLKKVINYKSNFVNVCRYASSLYVTGDKAHKHFAVLTPYVDFDKQLEKKQDFIENIKNRDLKINLNDIEEKWEFFKTLEEKKRILETTRQEISKQIQHLLNENKDSDEIEKLKLHTKLIKDDLKNLKDYYYQVEENVHLQVLSLPNSLHPKTTNKNSTIFEQENISKEKTNSHMESGKNLMHYINPYNCYLLSDAALFEMSIVNYFRKQMLDSNFVQFSSPDFSRSIVVEGCGKNFEDATQIITLEEPHDKADELSRLHLTGGGSLEAFMSYFTKHFVQSNLFPLRYFASGRKYQPYTEGFPRNLFNLTQETVVNLFISYLDNEDKLIEEVKNCIINLYTPLGYHFKIDIVAANKLSFAESLRFSVQMFSNHLCQYVEVGNVSLYDEYLSKRLLFTSSVNKEKVFPKIMAGTLLSVPKILGCVLENNSLKNEPLLTHILKSHICI